ncbi:MAG: UDP-N-acetylmuramate--L-alanine ligase, partial [Acidimicrobiia bacterium]
MHDPPVVPHKVHMVGAGGSGMSGLAKLLSQLGHDVTGSDMKPGRMLDSLRDVGIETWIGHRPDLIADAELVVCSSAVPDRDPELEAARDADVPIWHRPLLLAAITEATPTIGLAGTHGKTTSTALAVAALRGIGKDPSFLVGGEIVGLNTGAHRGSDDPFVLEADEAFGTFRHLDLDGILITNIEADHLDHYGSLAALEDAFAQVVGDVSGPRVACIDDAGVRRLANRLDVTSYGFSPDADWQISDLAHSPGGVLSFTISGAQQGVQVTLDKPGAHLAANACGVLVLLSELGYPMDEAAEALASFSGVRRRYETRASVRGVAIVDDYAHHPTEVAATIAAAKLSTTGRVIVIFQPHRYTRTASLGPEFGEPLALADQVIVTSIYAAGEVPIIGVSGRIVAQSAEAAGADVVYVERLADVSP